MAEFHTIQPSFASGEISPALYSRVDLNRYHTGLKTCKNMYIHPHGGSSNRPGTFFSAEVKDSSKKTRSVAFVFSKTQAYVLEFGHHYVRFYKNHGRLSVSTADSWVTSTDYVAGDYVTQSATIYFCLTSHTSGTFATDLAAGKWVAQTIYEVPTTYDEDDLADLKFERSADVLYIFHPAYQTRTLSRYDDTDWRFEYYSSDDGPFMAENLTTTTVALSAVSGTAVTMVASVSTFNADHVGALWKLTHYVAGQSVSVAFTGTATSASISCFTTWRVISHGTWTGKWRIEKSTDNGSTWTMLREFTGAADFNANTYGTEDIENNPDPFLIRLNCTDYTSGTANVDLSSDPFYQDGIVRVKAVANGTSCTAEVLTVAASTAATDSWCEGAWSDYRGWPSEGAFHQDRLVTAATTSEPMNVWMTQVGNYTSYRVNSSVLDSDGINVKLLSRQLNAVNGLVSLGDLLALTSASEWRVGADKTTLTPTTVFAKAQGYRGSYGIAPIVIGSQVIYVQSNGKVVRNFGYDYSVDSYVGIDLRILSEHLFKDNYIIDMAYQQDPDSLVWCVRDDGKLLAMTYMQEQDVVAWTQHETDGEVESICVIPASGYDELWMVVKRGDKRFIEYMAERLPSTDPHTAYFVDCGLQYDSPLTITGATQADPVVVTSVAHGLSNGDYVDISDVVGMTELNGNRYKVANKTADTFELTEEDSGDDIDGTGFTAYSSGGYARKCYTTFSGLSHLVGESVVILGNGEVYPEQVVNASGEVTLSRACSRISVGLPYVADFETLNIEQSMRDGTMQGKPVKISTVKFRVTNSRGGYVGPDFDTLHEEFIPERTSLGKAPELYTGDVEVSLGAGYENGGRVCYRQVDPLPITIGAVIPRVTVY